MPVVRKRFGQHFLTDPGLLRRIAEAVGGGPDDAVLEIGPGPGGLTGALAERGSRVVAIEKDRDLLRGLQGRWPNVSLVEGDALDLDWRALLPWPAIVCGNIPYNITTPLLEKALAPPVPLRVVFLVQKEVAERVAAAPGSETYGALSAGIQAQARVERLFTVKAGAFVPPPKVDSAVLRLVPRPDPLVSGDAVHGFRRLVVGLFGFRRKTLLRGMRALTGWEPTRAAAALAAAGIPAEARPEVLSPEQLAALYRAVVDLGWAAG
ncbi:MAG: 16S rRNA (adenine(1518)-N(6)/adenine(1519)-N(6))-dimethyltransferase RsmA [Gemmatimonadales bacterium]|nr:16S rRNA (adenine(1518)-N(6)/adenine(1519)-N(6))-dimethyltransferase RsmA [Gemmatimonadales bacterium]